MYGPEEEEVEKPKTKKSTKGRKFEAKQAEEDEITVIEERVKKAHRVEEDENELISEFISNCKLSYTVRTDDVEDFLDLNHWTESKPSVFGYTRRVFDTHKEAVEMMRGLKECIMFYDRLTKTVYHVKGKLDKKDYVKVDYKRRACDDYLSTYVSNFCGMSVKCTEGEVVSVEELQNGDYLTYKTQKGAEFTIVFE